MSAIGLPAQSMHFLTGQIHSNSKYKGQVTYYFYYIKTNPFSNSNQDNIMPIISSTSIASNQPIIGKVWERKSTLARRIKTRPITQFGISAEEGSVEYFLLPLIHLLICVCLFVLIIQVPT